MQSHLIGKIFILAIWENKYPIKWDAYRKSILSFAWNMNSKESSWLGTSGNSFPNKVIEKYDILPLFKGCRILGDNSAWFSHISACLGRKALIAFGSV